MADIDVLYIVGNGSLFDNVELKYSLRSLDKFGRNVGRLFITGQCPAFIDRSKVEFMPELDIGCPAINHWWKVHQTFAKTSIGERALLMYDDIFFCKPVDCANYPWRWRSILPFEKPDGIYRQSLYTAAVWLSAHGYNTLNYCLHQPCIYEQNKFLSMERDFAELKLSDCGMSVRSVYGNRFVQSAEKMDDLKIRCYVKNLPELLKDRDCFSIADNCYEGPVKQWLEQTFPEKSRWEK